MGFLILFADSLCSAEDFNISGGSGILLHQDNGQIVFHSGKISYSDSSSQFENTVNFLGIGSDMPWLSTGIFAVGYSRGFDFNLVKPKLTAGLIKSSEIEIHSGQTKIKNGGSNGSYINSKLSFDIKEVKITSSLLYAKVNFQDGDFYHFYGKPNLPALMRMGLSAQYKKTHETGFTYDKFDINIFNNSGTLLFESNNYSLGAYYKYSFDEPQIPWRFHMTSGVNYADIFVNGALTPANQQYFLFPYAFYEVNGKGNAAVGWMTLSFDLQRKLLKHRFDIIAANIFWGKLRADTHYKYRKFYGDDEVDKEVFNIDPAETGAAALIYSLKIRGPAVKNKIQIYAGAQKAFGWYYGMDKFTDKNNKNTGKNNTSSNIDYSSLLKTALLSGLAGNIKVTF
ncbi:MAG: hypothetical protein LBI42_05895 [Chitinispirillales bacterium]|nr:hypothetical protein [Chitinispirillales bacterium]